MSIRENIIEDLSKINPLAFKPKYKKLEERNLVLHSRGCTCKKSMCIKNYCECYAGGVGCTKLCKCINCKNDREKIND